MRVAVIGDPRVAVPPKQYGGTEQVIANLIKGLVEAGHEPVLLAPGDSKVDCELLPIIEEAMLFPKTHQEIPAFEQRLKEVNARTRKLVGSLCGSVDVIHSHGFDLRGFDSCPAVTTLHGRFTFDQLEYFAQRKNLNYISISHNQRQAYPDLHYVGNVYNGEDPSLFPVVTRPDEYVCFLGRFDHDKNPHLAIELALALGIKIKVAGKIDYDSEGYFEEKIARYFDHPLVEYLGELGFDDKIELLSHAACNIHPTGFREPFGLTVLEAAYCGTPTLAIRRGAMPELIQHGRTGMLVEDMEEGCHALAACCALSRRTTARHARTMFNYRRMTRGYVASYRRAIRAFKMAERPHDYRSVSESLRDLKRYTAPLMPVRSKS